MIAPPLRASPKAVDDQDGERAKLVTERWHDLDQSYLSIERTIEENARMLAGRQWDVWSDVVQSFVDPTRYMHPDELRWRQRPVLDFLGYWNMVTLSKVTENEPIIGFLPANADEKSAMLAEVMDPIFKTLADEAEMSDRRLQVAAWCLCAGEAYYISRPDYNTGKTRERRGMAVLGEEGQEMVVEDAPYDEEGNPLVEMGMDPETGEMMAMETGDPYLEAKGCLRVDVASPFEIRSQWGSHIPWNEKQWIIHRWFLTPDECEETFGERVEPDTKSTNDETSPGAIQRMLFGTGYFGASQGSRVGNTADADDQIVAEYVQGFTMWEKPGSAFPEGRFTVVAGNRVLLDAKRPFVTECAGPIRRVQFVPIPGRPIGTTPLERMVPLQRRYNRVEAQIAEHTNLCTNPILLISHEAGLDPDDIQARPGLKIPHSAPAGVRPAEWLSPPGLGMDVYKHKSDIRDHLFTIGSITGNDSAIPGSDSSGELIQQLRYNADRPLSMLTRSMELAEAGVAEDWMAILPTVWTEEEIVHYAGEDNVVKTITVMPEMWDGRVQVRPVMESAAPETREKRQERVMGLYTLSAFGEPGTPPAIEKLLKLSRYPELTRASRLGGVHRQMAEINLGKLLRGEQAEALPILPMYDTSIHLMIVDEYASGPDFLKMEPEIQMQVMAYRELLMAAQVKQLEQAMLQQGAANQVAQATGAVPDPSAPPSASGRPAGAKNDSPSKPGSRPAGTSRPGAGPV